MYILTYLHNEKQYIGFLSVDKKNIIPAKSIFSKLNKDEPINMKKFIDICTDSIVEKINELITSYKGPLININEVKIMAPIPYPNRNLFCLGKNYLDHINEVKHMKNVGVDIPSNPIYFSKTAYPAIGNNDYILSHEGITNSIDYEVELAVIIGKEGKNILPENVEDHIFGYTIANDISARDLQVSHVQWHKGKCLDTFCPMGPVIVHKSLLPLPLNLEIKCFVNNEERQSSTTSNMIFDIHTIISDLSKGITLQKGDIILTGTPAGVGMGFKPQKFLKSGDKVECYIEKIGSLCNYVK